MKGVSGRYVKRMQRLRVLGVTGEGDSGCYWRMN